MSAAFASPPPTTIFHKICGGRISECEPQMIMQPDNRKKLKEIRIVQGPHGPYPKWVLVK